MLGNRLFRSAKPHTTVAARPRPTGRLQVEALEDRSVPSAYLETDPAGDFLPGYTGVRDPGLDVVSYEAVLVGDRVVFAGEMAGPIAPTQAVGGLYIIGVDRGQGTPRFAGREPVIGPDVLWDSVVRVNPDGTGLFNNVVAGVITPLTAADITIDGNRFTARVPVSVMTPAATRPPEEWTGACNGRRTLTVPHPSLLVTASSIACSRADSQRPSHVTTTR